MWHDSYSDTDGEYDRTDQEDVVVNVIQSDDDDDDDNNDDDDDNYATIDGDDDDDDTNEESQNTLCTTFTWKVQIKDNVNAVNFMGINVRKYRYSRTC